MTIGIYEIENIETGQKYRGQSINIERRLKEHERCSDLDQWIDRAIKCHGSSIFRARILETFDEYNRGILNERERYWIHEGDTFNNPFHYNLAPGGEGFCSGSEHPFYRKDIDNNLIKDMYVNQKMTTTEIAEELGIHVNTIIGRLEKMNINRVYHLQSDLDDDLIKDMYVNQKMSSPKIANQLNVSDTTIVRHLKRMGVEILNKGSTRVDIPSSQELLEEYNSSNVTQMDLANKYNCSRKTICNRLKKAKEVVQDE